MAASFAPAVLRAAWTAPTMGTVVAREPWGRLERIADGVWALISDPLGGDRTTLANGGIIAGRDGVLAIEGLFTPHGARWLAAQARQLTGRWPTHVVLSHYHSDHANGVDGDIAPGFPTRVYATTATRDQVLTKNLPLVDSRSAALRDASIIAATGETVIDLGGRRVRVVPRAALANGTPTTDAGKAFTLPVSLGTWALFGPTFYERAFTAWNRELSASR